MFLKVGDFYLNTDLIKHFSVHINTGDETIEVKFYSGYPNILGSQIIKKGDLCLNIHREKLANAIVQFLCPLKRHPINTIKSLDNINEEATAKGDDPDGYKLEKTKDFNTHFFKKRRSENKENKKLGRGEISL